MYAACIMPKKVPPGSEFGERLYRLRKARGLTQIDLAKKIESSQRAISRYETVSEFPPGPVIVLLAKALKISADELLGIKKPKLPNQDPQIERLWKKFRQVLDLPEKDRRAIIRMINSLVTVRQRS